MHESLLYHGGNKFSLNPLQTSVWVLVENVSVWIQKLSPHIIVGLCPHGLEGSETLDTISATFENYEQEEPCPPTPVVDFDMGSLSYNGENDFTLNPGQTNCQIMVEGGIVELNTDHDGLGVRILSKSSSEAPISESYILFDDCDELLDEGNSASP